MREYLAEFIYRFNRHRLEQELFDRMVSACLWAPPTAVANIVAA